jgi:hypothetical protein
MTPADAIILVGLLPIIASATCSAEQPKQTGACYRIVVERHPTLCKQFVKNLNLFCDEPPMKCDLKVHHSMKHLFTLPAWEPLDPVENFERVAKMYRTSLGIGSESRPEGLSFLWKKWHEMEPEVRRKAASGRLKLSRARFDPLNVPVYWAPAGLGKPLVYRVDDLDCDPTDANVPQPRSPLFSVFDETTGDVDPRYARLNVERNRPVFYRGGYTYLSSWEGGDGSIDGNLDLIEPTGIRALCAYQYQGRSSK